MFPETTLLKEPSMFWEWAILLAVQATLLCPSGFSAMLGITEAAIFGINLRYGKPFIAALIGGAAGGAWVVGSHVYMTAVGLTAIPGIAIVQASSIINYVIGLVIAFLTAFVLSLLLKYKVESA